MSRTHSSTRTGLNLNGRVVGAETGESYWGLVFEDRIPLFPFLAEIDHNMPNVLVYIHILVESLQVLSLATLPYHNWGFALEGLLSALHFTHVPFFNGNILPVGFWACLGIMSAFVAAIILWMVGAAYQVLFLEEKVRNRVLGRTPMSILRKGIYFVASVAFVPLVTNLVAIMYCFRVDLTSSFTRTFTESYLTSSAGSSGRNVSRSVNIELAAVAGQSVSSYRLLWFPEQRCSSSTIEGVANIVNGAFGTTGGYTSLGGVSPAVVGATFVGVIGVLLVCVVALATHTLLFDTNPNSTHPLSRPHALLEAPYILFKVVAVVLMHAFLAMETSEANSRRVGLLPGGTQTSFSVSRNVNVAVDTIACREAGKELNFDAVANPIGTLSLVEATTAFEIPSPMLYFAIIMAVGSLCMACTYAFVLPYYHERTNRIRVAVLSAASLGAVLSAVSHAPRVAHYFKGEMLMGKWLMEAASTATRHMAAQANNFGVFSVGTDQTSERFLLGVPVHAFNSYYRSSADQAHLDMVLWLVLSLVGFLVGYFLISTVRVSSTMVMALDYLQEGAVMNHITHFPTNLPPGEDLFEDFELLMKDVAGGVRGFSGADQNGWDDLIDDSDIAFTFPYIDSVFVPSDIELSTRFIALFKDISNGMELSRFQLGYVTTIFAKGMTKFKASVSVRFAFACFLGFNAEKPGLALEQLQHMRGVPCTMTQRYQCWKTYERFAEVMHVNRSSSLEMYKKAQARHRDAMHHTLEFWQLLLADDVDKQALSSVTRSILTAKQDVYRLYSGLLRNHSSELDVVACYSKYCEMMIQNGEVTNQCLQYLRDLREQKQSNPVRGAKVKISDRDATSLDIAVNGNGELEAASKHTSVPRVALTTMTVVIVLACVGTGVTLGLYSEAALHSLDAVMRAGQLRGLTPQTAVQAANLVVAAKNANQSTPLRTPTVQRQVRQLTSLHNDFRAIHNQLFTSPNRPYLTEHRDFIRERKFASVNGAVLNFWDMGHYASFVLRDLAQNPLNANASANFIFTQFPTTVSYAYNRSVQLYIEGVLEAESISAIVMFVLLAAAVVATVFGVFVLFHNTHKMQAIRADIFSLFTLIPRKTRRQLHREARRKISELERFFDMSTRRKVISLVGAENEEEAEELNFGGSVMGSDHENSQYSMSQQSTVLVSSSHDVGTLQGSMISAIPSSIKEEILQEQRRQRAKVDLDDELAEEERSFVTDAVFRWRTIILFLVMSVAVVAITVLFGSAYYEMSNVTEFTAREELIQNGLKMLRWGQWTRAAAAQKFYLSGKPRFYNEYIRARQEDLLSPILSWMSVLDATPEEKQTFFELSRVDDAMNQLTDIGFRLCLPTFPLLVNTSSPLVANITYTPLMEVAWPGLEFLKFAVIADRQGIIGYPASFPHFDTSANLLRKSAPDQLVASKEVLFAPILRQLQGYANALSTSLKETRMVRKRRTNAEDFMEAINWSLVGVVSFACVLLVALYLHRAESALLSHPAISSSLVLTGLCLLTCFAVAIAGPIVVKRNKGWAANTLSGIHDFEDSLIATTHQVGDYARYYVGSANLRWLLYYRELLYPTASADTLERIKEKETQFAPRPDIKSFLIGGYERIAAVLADVPVSIQSVPGRGSQIERRKIKESDERFWVEKLYSVLQTAHQLTGIASRLFFNSTFDPTDATFQAFNATFLESVEWDFWGEQDADAVYARYIDTDTKQAFYNTTIIDLQQSNSTKLGMALGIVLSARLQGALLAAKGLIGSLTRSLSRSALEEDAQQVFVVNALLLAGLACSCTSVFLIALAVVGLFILYTRHISAKLNRSSSKRGGLVGSLAAHVDGQTFLSNTLPLLALVLIAILGCSIIVVVVFYKKNTVELPFLLNYATERSWLVSQSMFTVNQMLHTPSTFYEGRSTMKRLYLKLVDSVPALYFFRSPTSTLGVGLGSLGLLTKEEGLAVRHYFGAITDNEQDKLLFARSPFYQYDSTDTVGDRTNAVSSPSNLYVCNVSFGVELLRKVSVGVGIVYEDQWIDLVRQAFQVSTIEQLAPVVASMVQIYDALIMGIDVSNNQYHHYVRDAHTRWRSILIGLLSVLAGIAILNYLLLVRRFVDFLAEEESSARLMLHIIPEEARESNKQIAAFLNDGRILGSGDDLNEAISSMSTLPVLAIDQMGLIVRFTHAAEEAFGFSSAEVIGRNVKMLMPDDVATVHDSYLSNYRRTKVKHVIDLTRKVKAKRKNGEVFPIELSVTELKISESESYFIGFARDLTSQVDALVQDRLNKNIIEMNGDPIVMIDDNGLITQVNEAACTVFNYTSEELIHENVKMLMPAEVALNHDGYLQRYKQTGLKHIIDSVRDVQAQRKNGELFQVRLTVKEIKGSGGSDAQENRPDNRVGAVGTIDNTTFIAFISDITELHAAHEQNDINDLISNLSPMPIVAATSDGVFLKFSRAAEMLFGYKAAELIKGSRNISILCDPSVGNHDSFLRMFNRKSPAEKGASKVLNHTRTVLAMKKDGTRFPASVIVREVGKKGMDSVLVAYIVDISSSRGLDDGHHLNKSVMLSSPIPVILCGAQGEIVATNAACSEAFGYEMFEIVGRPAEAIMPFLSDLPQGSAGLGAYCASLRNTLFSAGHGSLQTGSIAGRSAKSGGSSNTTVSGGILANATTLISSNSTSKSRISTSLTGISTTLVSGTTNGQTADDRRAFHNNRIRSVEVLAKRKDGELVPVELTLREVLSSDDGPVMYFAFLKDISKSQEARKRFVIGDTMGALSTVPIISIDTAGIVENFSPASEICFGYTAADVIGENVRMLMPEDTAANHNAYLKRYFDTGIKNIIDSFRAVTARRKNGQLFSIELSVKEIKRPDGTTSGFVGYARDMSRERLLAEATIIGHKSKDLSIVPILEMTTGGDLLYCNRSLCESFGYRIDELLPWSVPKRKKGKRRDDNDDDHATHIHITSLLDVDVAELYRAKAEGRHLQKEATVAEAAASGLPQTWGYESAIRTVAHHKNGNVFDVEVTVVEVPQFNFDSESAEVFSVENDTVLIGFIRSVGVQLQLEQANKTIDTITNLSLIPIVAIDHRGVVIKYSLAAENAFGYPATEVLGNNVKMLMPAEVAQKHDGYLRAYHKTGLKTVIGNVLRHEAKRKDGTRFPLELAVKEIVKEGQHSLFISYLRDVSDDTALERAMGLSSMVIEQCMVPIIVISRKGVITTFNKAACAVFGYGAHEAVGENVSIIMTEKDARYHDRYLKAYAQTGVKNAVDNVKHRTALTKSGKAFPVEIAVKEVVPSSGDTRKRYFVSFVRDLTGEIQLKNASQINDVIASVSPIPLIGISDKGIILRFNGAAESAFGYTTAEVLGKNVKMLMPEEIAKRHDSYLHRCSVRRFRKREQARSLRKAGNDAAAVVAESEGVKFERFVYGRRRDGTQFPAELNVGEVVKAGHDSMYVGYIRDATYKFQAQHDQKISETAILLSPIPVIAIDTAGRVMSFNQAAEECFHYDAEEVIGRNVRMLMGREVADKHDEYIRNYLKTGVKRIIDITRDVVAKAKNGRKFPARLNVREIKEADRHYFLANLKNMSIVSALEHASSVNDSIVEMSTTAIVCINKSGIISKFSRSASDVFGYTSSEVIGKNVKMLMPPQFAQHHDTFIQRYLETGEAHILGKTTRNFKGLKKDGSSFHAEISVSEIPEVNDDDEDFKALRQSAEAVVGAGKRPNPKTGEDDESDSTLEAMSHVLSQSAARRSQTASMHRSSHQSNLRSTTTSDRSMMSQGGFIASIRDVTDRLTRLSEIAIIQNAGEVSKRALVVINGRGTIQRLNIAACQLFKYSKEELLGQNVKMLMPQELAGQHDSYLATYLRTHSQNLIGKRRRVVGVVKGGVQVQLALHIEDLSDINRLHRSRNALRNPIAEDDAVEDAADSSLFLAYIEDINLKEELSYAPGLASALIGLIPQPVVIIDKNGLIQTFNVAAEQVFEFTSAQVVGKNVSILMPEDSQKSHDRYIKQYLTTGEKHVIGSTRVVVGETKSGTQIQLAVSIREVRNDSEIQFVGVLRPVDRPQ